MDKNYNIDDILSEIKNRKLREKGDNPPEQQAARQDSGPGFPREKSSPNAPDSFNLDFLNEDPKPAIHDDFRFDLFAGESKGDFWGGETEKHGQSKDSGGFDFAPPHDGGEKPRNPLDFGGDAHPITERAKMRGGFGAQKFDFQFDGGEPGKTFESEPEIEPPSSRVFDFGPFNAPKSNIDGEIGEASSIPLDFGDTQEHTRVIPKFSTGRELKIEDIRKMDFGKARSSHGENYYDEYEEYDAARAGTVVDYSEYNSSSDRKAVQRDIARVKLWLFIRAAATLVLTAALFIFTLSGKFESIPLPSSMWPVPETMRAYLLACTVMTVLIALVNSSSVGGGLMGLFKMHANSDTLSACALLAAVAQGIVAVAKPDLVDPAAMNLYFCVAALAMLFNALGKMTMINRILLNFRIIASERRKKALLAVDDDEFCHEFVKDASRRRPTVAYAVRAGFFTDFLGLSYSDKYDVGINRAVAPVCLVGAAIVSVVTYFLIGSTFVSVSAFTAILCVCATLSSTFIENVPLGKLTKKLAPQGGMVSGTKAVEDYCETKALVLTESDLFPEGSVKLHGIKAYSQGRIDEAILDAASVLCAMDGALGPVFLEMIGGNRGLLKKVDNIVFENGMGVAAWVDSRRVLIGNRLLMQNHGISMPPESKQQAEQEGAPLYLSNSGEVSAQFMVSYHIDEELALALDQLANRDKLLIVHTTDANITAEKIWELYAYPLDLIRILPAEWHPKFSEMTAPRDTAVAEIVYTGKSSTLVQAVIACITARASILSATVIQLVQIVLGYGLVAFMAFMGSIGTISIVELCVYQLFWFISIFIVQKIRQS